MDETMEFEELCERKRVTFFGLPFSFTKYVLTGSKLVVHTGFLTSLEDEILLYRVMDLSLRRTLAQKIFGLGTIRVVSSDKSLPDLELKNIKNYRAFKDAISERVAHERRRMRTHTSEVVSMDDDFEDDLPDSDEL